MMTNSPQTAYFSFPTYESHFVNEIKAEEPTPVTPTPFHTALEPLIDVSTEAHSIIQHASPREAQIELNFLLARANLVLTFNTSASLGPCSQSSSCASSIMSSRPPSLIDSIKSCINLDHLDIPYSALTIHGTQMNSSQLICWSIGSHRKIIVGLLARIVRLFAYWKTSRILVLEHHRENFIARSKLLSRLFRFIGPKSNIRQNFVALGQLKLKT
ncbi:hypothetical protein PSTG_16787 [Puccinia striiformis f. sp. tritici PST-78]|uniref:Uncharacterized protein n=1 Tax=Puccinia striiformis f. sp. tritici PST-78 TaxID=1165861 RepID=A0A0L0USM1_9BASI|nr:hypothetical protein PSTG_16787 [Puccinia striiformis f. sp. tritici PST-78]